MTSIHDFQTFSPLPDFRPDQVISLSGRCPPALEGMDLSGYVFRVNRGDLYLVLAAKRDEHNSDHIRVDLTPDRWVRVMTDYSSDGFWNRDGVMLNREDVPISATLAKRHAAWCEWYETNLDQGTGDQKAVFDLEGFAEEGLAIARSIKSELPEWTVVYFDDAKSANTDKAGPRSQFEYEIETVS